MSAQPPIGRNRLPAHGLQINRGKTLSFTFDGNRFDAYEGDTIASALAANGQWLLSRSFKYHRPRGVLTMAGQDANTMVQLPSEPNVLADREPVRDGLVVKGQNFKGSLQKDRLALMGKFSKFLPVGFYYKSFYKPRGAWEKWAPRIRQMAGLGTVDVNAHPGEFDKQYLFCDVAVIGGGPAGLEAALQAAESGAEVILIEENALLGGAMSYARFDVDANRVEQQRQQLVAAVTANDNIRVMTDATCNGWFSDNWLPVIQANRLYKLRAKKSVICPGALEQQALFYNNDLPGVMMGSAAQRLIKLFGVRPGIRATVLTGNDDGYGVSLDLLDAGVDVAAVVDLRANPTSTELVDAVRHKGVTIIAGSTVYEAHSGADKKHISSVEVRRITARGKVANGGERINCDLLCMSIGYTPTYQLLCQGGAQLSYDDERAMFSIDNLPADVQIAGSVDGVIDLEHVRLQGRQCGWQATQELGFVVGEKPEGTISRDEGVNYPWPIFPHPKGKEFVDYDEDLQVADIVNAVADGYEHVQLVKRYSTVGMGPSQGRHSALATARLVADATGKSVAETGVTTARPPFAPEKLGHCAGASFYPERHSSMRHRHIELGAQFLMAGVWFRPAYYGAKGQRDSCMQAETQNVRNNVGLVDVSTLGGLDIRGPDAAEFIERLYTWGFKKQPVGRARYALLCNEAGVVIDDGVACRFHENHYYVTATTGGVDNVYRSMLKWNAQWRLDVDVANVTAAWAGVNIAGPNSRKVLERVCDDVDLSAEAFPYMGIREGTVAGIPARLIRVGFVGELGYEVHVPQHYGEALWDALMAAGQTEGIKPFGIEAQRLLRLEKGHIIISQDTDAMTFPAEVHMSWAISRKKPFFVGGRTIEEVSKQTPQRKQIGFVVNDNAAPIPQESHLIIRDDKMTGRVTSCYYSPTIGKAIGLAFVAPDQSEPGTTISIRSTGGSLVSCEVVKLPFYDPENERQEL